MAKADFGHSLISTRLDLKLLVDIDCKPGFLSSVYAYAMFGFPGCPWLCAWQNLYFVFLIISFNKVISTRQFVSAVLCRLIA